MGKLSAADGSTPPEGTLAAAELKVSGILSGHAPTPKIAEPEPSQDGSEPLAVPDADDLMLDTGAEHTVGADSAVDLEVDQPENADDQPELYDVKVDGETVKVSLQEALKGYSRQADYTRKTTVVAKEREQIAQDTAALREARAQYAARLAKLDEGLQAIAPKEPDWDQVKQDDPDGYPTLHADWERAQKQRQALTAERERVQQEELVEQGATLEKYVAAEREKLHAMLPVLQDPEKGPALVGALVQYGVSIGIPESIIRGEVNHLPVVILDKARRWDALQARKQKVTGKPVTTPTATPGSRTAAPRMPKQSREQEAARARLAQSHSPADAEVVLKGILAKK